jgi:hypothetical protein
MARTSPSQGEEGGSTPLRATKNHDNGTISFLIYNKNYINYEL